MIARPRLRGLGVCGGIAVFHYGISSWMTPFMISPNRFDFLPSVLAFSPGDPRVASRSWHYEQQRPAAKLASDHHGSLRANDSKSFYSDVRGIIPHSNILLAMGAATLLMKAVH